MEITNLSQQGCFAALELTGNNECDSSLSKRVMMDLWTTKEWKRLLRSKSILLLTHTFLEMETNRGL